uniref:Uncharacterized protein n=1 Tax=Arundo donax TaxID=35708 RepID=A0A0A9HFJ0_ARUDO
MSSQLHGWKLLFRIFVFRFSGSRTGAAKIMLVHKTVTQRS